MMNPILNASGQPIPVGTGARIRANASFGGGGGYYKGAATEGFDLGCWHTGTASADREMQGERQTMVARARDLVRNDGMMSGAVTAQLDAIIGTGVRFASKPDIKALGLSGDKAEAWARDFAERLEGLIKLWGQDPDLRCDWQGQQTFAEMQRTIRRHQMVDGDAFLLVRHRRRGEGAAGLRVALQMIDPDRVASPNSGGFAGLGHLTEYNDRIRAGVEIDQSGRVLAYHVANRHPNDVGAYRYNSSSIETRRISARVPVTIGGQRATLKRRQMLHAFTRVRADQSRGLSLFAPIMAQAKALHKYSEIELQTAQVNAAMAAFITSEYGPSSAQAALGSDGGGVDDLADYVQGRMAHHSGNHLTFGGGKLAHLYPGEKVEISREAREAAAFDLFAQNMARNLSAGLDIPYEMLTRDYRRASYSSVRSAMLQAWASFRFHTETFGRKVLVPVVDLIAEEAIDSGLLEMPPGTNWGLAEYHAFKGGFLAGDIIGPPRGWVDPVKEAQAAQIRMDAGLSTLEQEVAQQGGDWRSVIRQLAVERDEFDKHGLQRAQSALTPLEADANGDGQIDSQGPPNQGGRSEQG